MSCTTVLVGKNASNDRSTMIARTDDGHIAGACVISHIRSSLERDIVVYTIRKQRLGPLVLRVAKRL